jgi:hypothetical protein
VTNLVDSGPGSLRQAILDTPAGGTVDFQPGLTGTITLTSGELGIGNDLTIQGPGADILTVSGNHVSRVFDVAAGPTALVSGLTIADGTATGSSLAYGGGVFNAGTLQVTVCIFRGNLANATDVGSMSYGGGIYNTGALTLTDCTLRGNTARADLLPAGGGIANAGMLTISGCTLSSNSANGNTDAEGGGVYNRAMLTVVNSTLAGNTASGSVDAEGGGIDNFGTLDVAASTLSGNAARSTSYDGIAGAIFNFGTLTITESTLSGNTASGYRNGNGGGIYNVGTADIARSTLRGNTASGTLNGSGGGIWSQTVPASTSVWNVIIAQNNATSSPDVSGPLASQGHNLIGDGTGGSGFDATDLVGTAGNPVDPMLGPLQDNGGPTQTVALLPGSPAVDAGDPNNAPDFDQRGFPRIVGNTIDIGAFEVQPAGQATHLGYDVPDTIWAGTPFDITVTVVDDFGQPAVGYLGTIQFTINDGQAGLPADYTFTAADGGQHLITGQVLLRAQVDTITGADTANSLINGHVTFTVTPATADHLTLTVAAMVTSGLPMTITATVQDAYGNTVTDYVGTLHFTLSGTVDRTLDYGFSVDDRGSHTFTQYIFYIDGPYTLDATDFADVAISGTTQFTVVG